MLVHLHSIVINVLMFLNILVYYIIILYYYAIILFVFCSLYYYIIMLVYSYIIILLYYLCIVFFSYTIKKCSTIFKYFFYIIVHSTCCIFCICYSSMLKYYAPHKPDLTIEVLNLIWLLLFYVLCVSSFILTHFFVLNLVVWFGLMTKKSF